MKTGIYFYGLATAAFGVLDLIWGQFEASHQPVRSLTENIPGQQWLAYMAAGWMIAAGLATLWRRSARAAAAASAIIYLVFVACWLLRFFSAIHTSGWRFDILFGFLFSISEAVLLVAPAAILYVLTAPGNPLSDKQAETIARWMLGVPPIFFGVAHLLGVRFFATIVPHWLPFRAAWTVLTGIAFLLAGGAICLKICDVLAARLLALMLLLFEILVEIPPVFVRLHNQETWGAAVYNLAAIGALWIFAEFIVSRRQADSRKTDHAGHSAMAAPVGSLAAES